MTQTYLPEARKNIVAMLDNAMTAFLKSVQKESFSDPYATENLELTLEATASAVRKLINGNPERAALLKTFALELLDQSDKE